MKSILISFGFAVLALGCSSKSNNTTVTAVVQNEQVNLSWGTASGYVADYYIEQSTGGAYTRVASVIAPATSVTIGGLAKGTAYSFRVQAHNAKGASSYTDPVSITP